MQAAHPVPARRLGACMQPAAASRLTRILAGRVGRGRGEAPGARGLSQRILQRVWRSGVSEGQRWGSPPPMPAQAQLLRSAHRQARAVLGSPCRLAAEPHPTTLLMPAPPCPAELPPPHQVEVSLGAAQVACHHLRLRPVEAGALGALVARQPDLRCGEGVGRSCRGWWGPHSRAPCAARCRWGPGGLSRPRQQALQPVLPSPMAAPTHHVAFQYAAFAGATDVCLRTYVLQPRRRSRGKSSGRGRPG